MPIPVSATRSRTSGPAASVSTVSVPPSGMASRALTMRFMITWPSWPWLTGTQPAAGSSLVTSAMRSPTADCSTRVTLVTTWFRLTGVRGGPSRRVVRRTCCASAIPHSVAFLMDSALARSGSFGLSRRSISSL